jgi:hypothetical protein
LCRSARDVVLHEVRSCRRAGLPVGIRESKGVTTSADRAVFGAVKRVVLRVAVGPWMF